MKLEQLNNLTDDEIAMLWHSINKIDPPVLTGIELEPELFPCIKHKNLMNRLVGLRIHVKEEHLPLFDGLVAKLNV
jgi:hypothetical protein